MSFGYGEFLHDVFDCGFAIFNGLLASEDNLQRATINTPPNAMELRSPSPRAGQRWGPLEPSATGKPCLPGFGAGALHPAGR